MSRRRYESDDDDEYGHYDSNYIPPQNRAHMPKKQPQTNDKDEPPNEPPQHKKFRTHMDHTEESEEDYHDKNLVVMKYGGYKLRRGILYASIVLFVFFSCVGIAISSYTSGNVKKTGLGLFIPSLFFSLLLILIYFIYKSKNKLDKVVSLSEYEDHQGKRHVSNKHSHHAHGQHEEVDRHESREHESDSDAYDSRPKRHHLFSHYDM